jgi:drug/metabolite transporter (DMT)-like permease
MGMKSDRRTLVVVCLAVLYTVWGSTYLAQRVAVSTFTPLQMAGLRFTLAGGLLMLMLVARGKKVPTRAEWQGAVLSATPLMVFGMGTAAYAVRRVPSGLGALVFGAVPIFTSIFSRVLGRKLSLTEVLGLAVGIGGVACVSLRGGLRNDPLGAGLLLLAASFYALGCLLTARMKLAPGAMGTASQMLFAGVVLTGASLVLGETWVAPTRASLFSFVYLVVAGSMVAYTALGYLLRTVRPALATSYAFMNPIVALALGRTIANEPLGRADVAGLLLVLVAVGLIARGRTVSKTESVPEEPLPSRSPLPRDASCGVPRGGLLANARSHLR